MSEGVSEGVLVFPQVEWNIGFLVHLANQVKVIWHQRISNYSANVTNVLNKEF
jgi:hypothetical protein